MFNFFKDCYSAFCQGVKEVDTMYVRPALIAAKDVVVAGVRKCAPAAIKMMTAGVMIVHVVAQWAPLVCLGVFFMGGLSLLGLTVVAVLATVARAATQGILIALIQNGIIPAIF